jgi:hypothetical protein
VLRDLAEVLAARGVHELNAGRNRVIADQSLWRRKDIGKSFVEVIAQAIQHGKLPCLDAAEVTLGKLYRAWNQSWHADNEAPGWFLIAWALESGNLAAMWPSIRSQVSLILAQDRLANAVERLGAAVSSLCA